MDGYLIVDPNHFIIYYQNSMISVCYVVLSLFASETLSGVLKFELVMYYMDIHVP